VNFFYNTKHCQSNNGKILFIFIYYLIGEFIVFIIIILI